MKLSSDIRIPIYLVIISISMLIWILLFKNPGSIMTESLCHATINWPSQASVELFLLMNPVSDLMLGWTLMVLGMMLPKLIIPIQYIYARSLKRLRLLLAILFLSGYVTVWIIAGVVINAAIIGLNLLLPISYIPAIIMGITAMVWQFSPMKQQFLNRGHDHLTLAAFGWSASRDAISFGVMHGVWCVGSGWAMMMLPMLLHEGHNTAMLIVTFIMISEHLEHQRAPQWQLSMRLKLWRIFVAQTRIKVRQVLEFG
jgi:predicted metal-binding membrane protein